MVSKTNLNSTNISIYSIGKTFIRNAIKLPFPDILTRSNTHAYEKKYSYLWEYIPIGMSIFSHRCEYCPLSEYPETPFYSVSDKGLTNRINQYIGRIQVCFRYHVLERQRQSAFVRQDAASVLCCGCGKTCCAPSKNIILCGWWQP